MVKEKEPVAVGVPVMAPVAVLSERPVGSAPAVTAKVYGAVPPEAETVWLYAVVTEPSGRVAGETVIVGQAITIVYAWLPAQRLTSAAVIVKLKVPDVVGVPVIAPVEALRESPVGSAPVVMLYTYGETPPEAE